jgi:hypothetical protein
MTRRACLTIGVATVTPPPNEVMRFAYLDGAVLAARAIGAWALHSGFGADNVRIVDDEASPVTRDRVQKAVDELFPAQADAVEHLILAFCGHGLTDENVGSISWLFSDSLSSKYRVVADKFYTELLFHKIQRITLISDACREAPKDIDLMRFDAVRGIVVQGGEVESPKFDRFVACQDGQLGYMVLESPAKPGKCVFSGVIADVLWGKEPAAIDGNGLITTATFGTCVRSRTAERAKDYRLKLNPQCLVDPESLVLYDKTKPPANLPELQPWPATAAAAAMGTALPVPAPVGNAPDAVRRGAMRNLELVRTDETFRKRILGSTFGSGRPDLGISNESLTIPDTSKDVLEDLVRLRNSPSSAGLPGAAPGRRLEDLLVNQLESDAVADARKRAAQDVQRSMADIGRLGFSDGSNLIVMGQGARLWSRSPVQAGRLTPMWAGFRVDSDREGTPVLIELTDHSFTPHVPYEGLFAVVKQGDATDVLQAYGDENFQDAIDTALAAIADFSAGRIGADGIDRLASQLRSNKHADPVLGAICAYLYRATADFDSIRRMAYFYVMHNQPVPFDIALLGAMSVTREANGVLKLDVPAVKARTHKPGQPELPAYVTDPTPAAQASIGGRCPWLGLGWDYVGVPRPEWAPLVDGLAVHAAQIRRSGFTVLPNAPGLALAQSWQLQPR